LNFDMEMTTPFTSPIKKYIGMSITVLDSIYTHAK
jgi:hypothetical protein